jgi:hypothetical protein
MLTLHVITHRLVLFPKDIRGSIEERYWIYRDIVKFSQRLKNSKISWYSTSQNALLQTTAKGCELSTSNCITHLFKILSHAISTKNFVFIFLAYPYVLISINKLFFLVILSILRLITCAKRNIIIILDDIDPPVETSLSDSAKPFSLFKYGLSRIYDMLILKLVSRVIILTESYRKYFSKLYKISEKKFIIVPPPALCALIPYSPPKSGNSLNVLYSGVVKKKKEMWNLLFKQQMS